jgi:hypothetical protein
MVDMDAGAHVSHVIYTPNLVQYEQTCFMDLFFHFLLFHMLYFFLDW